MTGNTYIVSDYEGTSTPVVFTLSTTINADDVGANEWIILPKFSKYYLGQGLLTYIRRPLDMADVAASTSGYQCELNEQLCDLVMLLAEASIWRHDGKYDRANQIFARAKLTIDTLNGTLVPSDNIGPGANRE